MLRRIHKKLRCVFHRPIRTFAGSYNHFPQSFYPPVPCRTYNDRMDRQQIAPPLRASWTFLQVRGRGFDRMDIKRNGSQPSGKGSDEYFTGTARIDPLFQSPDPARAVCASVTFEPGARTAWHTHPLGQTLIVTAGCGRAQHWGGPIEEIR